MNDLRLDEVRTTFLDPWLVSFAMLASRGVTFSFSHKLPTLRCRWESSVFLLKKTENASLKELQDSLRVKHEKRQKS